MARVFLAACSVLVGLVLRLAISVSARHVELSTDMRLYQELARRIAIGEALTSIDRPLLYPVLVAATYHALASQDVLWTYLLQTIVSLMAVLAVAALSRILLGRATSFWALVLAAPLLTLAQYSSLLLTETCFALVFTLWLVACFRSSPEEPWFPTIQPASPVRVLLGGILAGIGSLLRPSALSLAFGTAIAIGLRAHGKQRVALPSVFALAVALAYGLGDHALTRLTGAESPPVPTSGVNLYLGNSAWARWDGGGRMELPPEIRSIADPVVRDREARRLATAYAMSHPFRTLTLVGVRAIRLIGINPGRVEHDALVAEGFPSVTVTAWLAAEWWLIALLAAVVFDVAPRCRHAFGIVLVVLGPYLAVVLLTFVQTRFRLPVFLLLVPFAGAAIAWLRASEGPSWAGVRAQMLWTRWSSVRIVAILLSVGALIDLLRHGT